MGTKLKRVCGSADNFRSVPRKLPLIFLSFLIISLSFASLASCLELTYNVSLTELESSTYASPYEIDLTVPLSSFTINFDVTGSYDNGNLTIIAMNDDDAYGMYWTWWDDSGNYKRDGGNYHVASEIFTSVEGGNDPASDSLMNVTMYADYQSQGERVYVDGVHTYNAWSFDSETFDTIWIYTAGGGVWEETGTGTININTLSGDSPLTDITDDILVQLLSTGAGGTGILIPIIIILVCAFVAWRFAGEVGAVVGINVGIFLCLMFLDFPAWTVIGIVIVDVVYFFGGKR